MIGNALGVKLTYKIEINPNYTSNAVVAALCYAKSSDRKCINKCVENRCDLKLIEIYCFSLNGKTVQFHTKLR